MLFENNTFESDFFSRPYLDGILSMSKDIANKKIKILKSADLAPYKDEIESSKTTEKRFIQIITESGMTDNPEEYGKKMYKIMTSLKNYVYVLKNTTKTNQY
jgi:hypothetical protein